MTLYLKYRPKNLDELDLKDVAESLKNILSKKSIPHAFLFAGPKGTGKTSAARILAKIVNCEQLTVNGGPCGECEQCISIEKGNNLDVIEMDAASHRGIDDVRILRDAVKLSPVSAKKKIYIIDEAHMLTTEASNALLKTLEEPPEHVIFILATTNPEKLIETIRSRTTFIPFRKANTAEIVKSLKRVVLGEKIKADDETLNVIAEASDGSFRDGIKILEQLVAEEKDLSKEFLEEFLFKKKDFDIENIVSLLVKKDVKKLIEEIGKLGAKGVNIETFITALLSKLRTSLLAKVGIGVDEITDLDKFQLINLIELMNEASVGISESLIEELPLEIAVIKWCDTEIKNQKSKIKIEGEAIIENTLPVSDSAQTIVSDVREHAVAPVVVGEGVNSDLIGVNDDVWKNILSLVKPINASIEALLRSSKPITYDGKELTLGVYYKFHKERLEDVRHRKILEEVVAKVLGSPTKVSCTLVDPPPRKIIEEIKIETVLTEGKDRDIIKVAEEIFGN
jgi:DNA polymerase-3 subunit gamma/tau